MSATEKFCREMLDIDFISPKEMMDTYGFSYSQEQLKYLNNTLPSIETLIWLQKNGYILIPGPPEDMNLINIRNLDGSLFLSKNGGWYTSHKFGFSRKDFVKDSDWLAIRKEAHPLSFEKTWEQQQCLLSKEEYVPNVAEISYAITVYYKIHRVRLFADEIYVRTSSTSEDNYQVIVGGFGKQGLRIDDFFNNRRGRSIGISVVAQ